MGTVKRQFRQRDSSIGPSVRRAAAILETADLPDRAVKPHDIGGAGALVQSVHVLGDQGEPRLPPAPLGQDLVRAVGRGGRDQLAPPVIPLPDGARVPAKSLRRGEVFRARVLPEPGRAAKPTTRGEPTTEGRPTAVGNAGRRPTVTRILILGQRNIRRCAATPTTGGRLTAVGNAGRRPAVTRILIVRRRCIKGRAAAKPTTGGRPTVVGNAG